MRDLITILEAKSSASKIEPIELSYSINALSPVLSANNLRQHHKLWHSYCEKFNEGTGDKQYNYAGCILHNLFFSQFRQPRGVNPPNGPIASFIKTRYKSYDNFQDKFEDVATKFTGSGWVYLARDGSIKNIINHAIRQDIVLLLDMWEHSYIIDHGGNKGKYVDGFWKIINWNVINTRYMAPYRA